MDTSKALVWAVRRKIGRLEDEKSFSRVAGWFFLAFRGDTLGAFWPMDLTFHSDSYVVIEPQVLKKTREVCRHSPEARGFWAPEDTPIELNPIPFVRKHVDYLGKNFGKKAFILAPICDRPSTSEFLSLD